MTDRYCIRDDYRARRSARRVDASEAYWSPSRVALSGEWQYDVYRLARKLVRQRGYKSVLDVGSGPATKVRDLIAPVCGEITLVDQPSTREIAKGTVPDARFVGADLAEIDLELGRRFDLVICADVIEHLLDPDPCLEFIRRHVSPDGAAVISTPDRDHLRGPGCLSSPHPEHVREWSGSELRAYLESRGFRVERHDWFALRRTNPLDLALGRLLGRFVGRRRWSACQVAVAGVGAP